jgi:tetratricopeptide (TPR) repeat protein
MIFTDMKLNRSIGYNQNLMNRRLILLALFVSPVFLTCSARADGLDDQTVPGRWIRSVLPENVPPPNYPDYDKGVLLEEARAQVFSGQYRRALVSLEKVTKGKPTDITIMRGQALLALGRFDQALTALGDAAVSGDPAVQILRSRVQEAQGDFSGAIETINGVISQKPDLIESHFRLGQYQEDVGNIPAATAAYGWFTSDPHNLLAKWQSDAESFTSAEDVTYLGRALDRWAVLDRQYQKDSSLHNTILNMFVKAYDIIDRDYWPAHAAAAEYFMAHDETDQFTQELRQALNANPNDIDCLNLLGAFQYSQFNFAGVETAIERMRGVDENSNDADVLEAENDLLQQLPKRAVAAAQRVLSRQPKHIAALGLLAAADAMLLNDDDSAAVLKQVDLIDPNNYQAYLEIADVLGLMRQYPRAEAMYKIAVERAPWSAPALNGLGLLYTQSGDEDSARKVMESARIIDPFNLKTTNYMRLLDEMEHFAKVETTHFIVKYDADSDPIVPEYFSDYLESIYPQVCGAYGFEPKEKTLIEVFPTHDAFAVRTTGGPWLATVGASSGRLIALTTPRKGAKTLGTYNWTKVLRHEFTHTVTLGLTENRIAHWFTEGLAVQQEHYPVRWEWVPLLYNAVTKNKLLLMDELNWGFIRPRIPSDHDLAYAESSWICQYIEETYGHQAILDMLEQFRIGKDQDEVFRVAVHRDQTQFFGEFQSWCQKQVAGWGYDDETTAKYGLLRAEAEGLIKSKDSAKAVVDYEEIAKLRPADLYPHQRLAGLFLSLNQSEKAAAQLDIMDTLEQSNDAYALAAGRIYLQMGKLDEAAKRAQLAVFIDPYDSKSHKLLADVDEKLGNSNEMQREQRVITELEQWQASASTRPE